MDKEIMKKIATLIFKRVQKGKKIDKEYMEELVHFLVTTKEIKNSIEKVKKFRERKGITYLKQSIFFCFASNLEDIKIEGYDKDFYCYLTTTRELLKHIAQAQQMKQCTKILNRSLQDTILKQSYYNPLTLLKNEEPTRQQLIKSINSSIIFAPEERYANISSYNDIMEISELLERKNLTKTYMLQLYDILLRPYYQTHFYIRKHKRTELAPTLCYLESIGYPKINSMRIRKKSQNLDVMDRLKLGLDINDNELTRLQEERRKLTRSLLLK